MLIQTKIAPPAQSGQTLHRTALVDAITRGPTSRLVVINAPAGYGKTTLLGQCFAEWAREGVIVGWYSVDDRRFELEQFFAYVMYGLFRAGVPLPYSEQAIIGGLPGIADLTAANALLAALEACEEPVRLIIDDYHKVASPPINDFMAYVIDRLPSHASIVMSMRGRIELPISSFKARGQVLILNQCELRFTEAETADFFQPGSPPTKWAQLTRETEGWPAIMHLLRINGGQNLERMKAGMLVASTADLANYLAEQIFVGLSADLQAFLLDIAWVDEICEGLANALTGRDDGQVQLDRMAEMNLLVTPVARRAGWYRFHPLFTEFLQSRLAHAGSDQSAQVHRKAAQWFVESGMLAEALEHAVQLPDSLAALSILEGAKGWRLALQGGFALLRHITETRLARVESFPRTWLARCYFASHEGRTEEARTILQLIKSRLRAHPEIEAADTDLRVEVLAIEVITLLYEGEPIPQEISGIFLQHLEEDVDDPFIETLLRHLLCAIAFSEKEHAICHLYGQEALRGALLTQMPFTAAYTHQYLGLSHLAQGRVHEAEISLRRAAEQATRHFGDGSSPLENTRVLLARTFYLKGESTHARVILGEAIPNIERVGGWFDTFALAYETQAWIFAQAGEPDLALAILMRARRMAAERTLPRLACYADIWEARLKIYWGMAETVAPHLDRARSDMAALGEAGSSLTFALWMAEELADLACGRNFGDKAKLIWRAARSEAVSERIEACVLRALTLVGSAPREAVLVFREALELGDSEGLPALIAQFGALLEPLSAIAHELIDMFAPAQRATVRAMGVSLERQGANEGIRDQGDSVITRREVDVLRALADGLSSKEIARRLGVAESTIKTHRINIYRKLDVSFRSGAIEAARKMNLI